MEKPKTLIQTLGFDVTSHVTQAAYIAAVWVIGQKTKKMPGSEDPGKLNREASRLGVVSPTLHRVSSL